MKKIFNLVKIGLLSNIIWSCNYTPQEDKSFADRVKSLKTRVSDLEDLIVTYDSSTDIKSLKEQYISLDRELEFLKGFASDSASRQEVDNLREALNKVVTNLHGNVQEEIKQLHETLESERTRAEEAEKKLGVALTEQKEEIKKEQEAKLVELTAQLQTLKAALGEEGDIEKLREALDSETTRAKEAEKKLMDVLTTQKEEQNKQLAGLTAQLGTLQDELELEKDTHLALGENLGKLGVKIGELEGNFGEVNENLGNLTKTVNTHNIAIGKAWETCIGLQDGIMKLGKMLLEKADASGVAKLKGDIETLDKFVKENLTLQGEAWKDVLKQQQELGGKIEKLEEDMEKVAQLEVAMQALKGGLDKMKNSDDLDEMPAALKKYLDSLQETIKQQNEELEKLRKDHEQKWEEVEKGLKEGLDKLSKSIEEQSNTSQDRFAEIQKNLQKITDFVAQTQANNSKWHQDFGDKLDCLNATLAGIFKVLLDVKFSSKESLKMFKGLIDQYFPQINKKNPLHGSAPASTT